MGKLRTRARASTSGSIASPPARGPTLLSCKSPASRRDRQATAARALQQSGTGPHNDEQTARAHASRPLATSTAPPTAAVHPARAAASTDRPFGAADDGFEVDGDEEPEVVEAVVLDALAEAADELAIAPEDMLRGSQEDDIVMLVSQSDRRNSSSDAPRSGRARSRRLDSRDGRRDRSGASDAA